MHSNTNIRENPSNSSVPGDKSDKIVHSREESKNDKEMARCGIQTQRKMDDEQKPDPLLLRLITYKKKANNEPTKMLTRSTNWSNKGSISIKKEAWPSSNEATNPRDLASATKDWIPTKPAKKTHDQEPEMMVPLLLQPNEMKHLGKPCGIPTRPRSELKRKARRCNQQPQSSMKKAAEDLRCEVCEISCSSKATLQQHLMGRPHKAKLLYKRGCNGDAKGKPRCDVCQIWCSDRDGLNMHFKGQKHKAKLQLCHNNGGHRVSKSPIMCQLCHVPCMNEDLFNMHLKGKQHITKVELNRRGLVLCNNYRSYNIIA